MPRGLVADAEATSYALRGYAPVGVQPGGASSILSDCVDQACNVMSRDIGQDLTISQPQPVPFGL